MSVILIPVIVTGVPKMTMLGNRKKSGYYMSYNTPVEDTHAPTWNLEENIEKESCISLEMY